MKIFINFLIIFFTFLFLLVPFEIHAQTNEDWQCGVAHDTSFYQPIENITPIINDTLKVGLLLVQFADWQDSIDSRGGVGWSHISHIDSVDTSKYKYDDYWNTFFSRGTYYDADPENPTLHPDGPTHDIAVYGSFTDYWWEVSHKNLYTEAAETHPGAPGIYSTGLINRVNPDGTVQWITLDSIKHAYWDSLDAIKLMDSLIVHSHKKAHEEYILSNLDVDIYDDNVFDKIIIQYAGNSISGFSKASAIGGRYTISNERRNENDETQKLNGFGIDAHEFGHLIGFYDLYGYGFGHYGVGYFSLMGLGPMPPRGVFLPAHVDPWHKLQTGWLDYTIIDSDTNNVYLSPVEDTISAALPKVAILKGLGEPGNGNWNDDDLDYFILENRSVMGFDRFLKWRFENLDFDGGLVVWHCAGKYVSSPFPGGLLSNKMNLQIVEADNDFAISNKIDWGRPHDFFPGPSPQNVSFIDDTTSPNIRLHNNQYSHNGVYGIQYDQNNNVYIDSISTDANINFISVNTTWSNTVNIHSDVVVNNGAILTIEPGTIVNIDPKSSEILSINFEDGAQLNANGTETSPIVIKSFSNNSTDDWKGFIFKSGSAMDISWLIIENAMTGINAESINSSNETFIGLTFKDCSESIKLGGQSIYFDYCSFIRTNLLIDRAINFSFTVFDSCEIRVENNSSFNDISNSKISNGSLIYCNINSFIEIENNTFIDSSRVKIINCDPVIKNNLFIGINNLKTAIEIRVIEIIVQPYIINNTISNYNFAIEEILESGEEPPNPTIKNNIFYQNQNTGSLTGVIRYNDFYNISNSGAPINQNGNIDDDPLFVDPENEDFTLDFDSPCIDAGDPSDDFSNELLPNGGRINMGHQGNTDQATESFDIIAHGTVLNNTTWQDTVLVKDDLLIHMSADLTITYGTYVVALPDKLITVKGKLISNAIENEITFTNYRNYDKWQGIYIDHSEETSVFNKSKILNANTGLYVENSEVEISNSLFKDNNTGFIGDNATGNIEECSFDSNYVQGAYFSQSQMDVLNSSFDSNGGRGVYVQYGSGMTFIEDTIKYNGCMDPDIELKGGMVLYSSSPLVQESEIVENEYNGILTLSVSDPVMNQEEKGYNLIAQNGDVGEESEYAEIQCMDVSVSKLDYGHNDIIDNRGDWLIYSHSVIEVETPIRGNYWGTDDEEEIEERIYGFFDFTPFDESANTVGGGTYSEGEKTFQRGLENETNGDITGAISAYDSVIQFYPAEVVALNALDRKYTCYKLAKLDFNNLRSEYINLSVNHSNEDVRKRAKNLSISCLIELENYSLAISEYDTLITNSQNNIDSLYAETDKALAELKQSGNLLSKATGSSITPKYFKQAIEKSENYRNKTENLLSQRFTSIKKSRDVVPVKFALYQNYPNPFNPSTTIKFDLPKRTDVKLIIYNILGQEIITLLNENKDSGRFEIKWNGRNNADATVASGLYIYRIITNDFTKSKKMLLLR